MDAESAASDLIMWYVGCAFGRWDVRSVLHASEYAAKLPGPFDPLPIHAPGALSSTDAPPPYGSAGSEANYPIPINEVLLVDDATHPDAILARVRAVMAVVWGEGANEVEHELCSKLGTWSLEDYLRRMAGFFAHHLQRYSKSRRKAPIYWPLSTPSSGYTLWLYYPRLTSDILYTAVNKYVEPKLVLVGRELADAETRLAAASGSAATRLRGELERQRAFRDELEWFRVELLRVAAMPYRPNLDDGVVINAAPLWKLFRLPKWARATRETWEKLERGDYDWAHLAYAVWPERVREKCRSDRSLAIAHGLEELYEAPAGDQQRQRPRGRRRKAVVGDEAEAGE